MRLSYLILAVFTAGCGENALQPLDKTKDLIILTRVGSITYSVDGITGATGFDYDLARLLAQELGSVDVLPPLIAATAR